jgi:hypothetical protein
VADCFSDGLCLVESVSDAYDHFLLEWDQNGGQINGYAYFQGEELITGRAGLRYKTSRWPVRAFNLMTRGALPGEG